MNLYEKLLEIQKTVAYLKKDNQGFQYQYVSSSQTVAIIRSKMDELKVLLVPRVTGKKVERHQSENDKGKISVQFFTELDMTMDWIDAEKPDSVVSCTWYAQGIDTGEKGVGKAYTYAEKYFLLKFFHIATDKDDPDAFQEKRIDGLQEEPEKPKTAAQRLGPFSHSKPFEEHKREQEAARAGGQKDLGSFKTKIVSGKIGSQSQPGDPKPWTLYLIETTENGTIGTFSKTVYDLCGQAKASDAVIILHCAPTPKGPTIEDAEWVTPQAEAVLAKQNGKAVTK